MLGAWQSERKSGWLSWVFIITKPASTHRHSEDSYKPTPLYLFGAYEDQYNLYAYVGNDPVNATDPTGEFSELAGAFSFCTNVGGCAPSGSSASSENSLEDNDEALDSNDSANLISGRGHNRPPRPPGVRIIGNRSGMIRIGPEGLRSHEGGPHNGHTVRLHVGRTNQQLFRRIKNENLSQSSTFTDYPTAAGAFREAVRVNNNAIKSWLGSGGIGSFPISVKTVIPIGRVATSNGAIRNSSSATFIIRANHNPNFKSDIVAITGFVN